MRAIASPIARGPGLAVLVFVGVLAPSVAIAQPRAFEGERAVASDASVAEPDVRAATPTTPTTAAPSEPTTVTAAPQPAATPAKAATPKRLPYPRLVIAGGPIVGPHAFGNEECRSEEQRCETHGTFFGVGANVELRVRLWRPIYAHARGIVVGNASPRDPVHRGLYGGGLGIGAYARRAFGRAEYLLVDTFGNDRFARPFGDPGVGRDRWGHHAGLFSAGARLPFGRRFTAELWGGLMVGPRSTRSIPDAPVDHRTLLTFLAGVNIAYDLIPARAR